MFGTVAARVICLHGWKHLRRIGCRELPWSRNITVHWKFLHRQFSCVTIECSTRTEAFLLQFEEARGAASAFWRSMILCQWRRIQSQDGVCFPTRNLLWGQGVLRELFAHAAASTMLSYWQCACSESQTYGIVYSCLCACLGGPKCGVWQ